MTYHSQAKDFEQYSHELLPEATHDELARQEFVKSFKYYLASHVSPDNKKVYEEHVRPAFEKKHGRPPKDRHEVRKEMVKDEHYQAWSSLLRTSQEMMWDSVRTSVQRQLGALIEKSKKLDGKGGKAGGTLRLDPDLEVPKYHTAVDIHCMPGGYHTDLTADDVAAGAVYDRAVYIYAMGRMGPYNDDIGASQAAWLKAKFPDLKPKRILDMGCSVGHSTIPYKLIWPDAEVYGIDVGAPMVRYAHARAEALGMPIHFSQQNAEKTDFEDESFDLIVSHILVHETAGTAFRNIMKECNRLLKPGGVVAHSETPPYEGMDPYDAFLLDWDTYNNNEPFWGASHELNPAKVAKDAGFDPKKAFSGLAPSAFEAAQNKRTNVFQGGDFGGGGMWYVFGVRK
jgi:SAM-dependent methyltransferase